MSSACVAVRPVWLPATGMRAQRGVRGTPAGVNGVFDEKVMSPAPRFGSWCVDERLDVRHGM